jgi:hypothetical protein
MQFIILFSRDPKKATSAPPDLREAGRIRISSKSYYNEFSTPVSLGFGPEVREGNSAPNRDGYCNLSMRAVFPSYGVGLAVSPSLVLPDPLPN